MAGGRSTNYRASMMWHEHGSSQTSMCPVHTQPSCLGAERCVHPFTSVPATSDGQRPTVQHAQMCTPRHFLGLELSDIQPHTMCGGCYTCRISSGRTSKPRSLSATMPILACKHASLAACCCCLPFGGADHVRLCAGSYIALKTYPKQC